MTNTEGLTVEQVRNVRSHAASGNDISAENAVKLCDLAIEALTARKKVGG